MMCSFHRGSTVLSGRGCDEEDAAHQPVSRPSDSHGLPLTSFTDHKQTYQPRVCAYVHVGGPPTASLCGTVKRRLRFTILLVFVLMN